MLQLTGESTPFIISIQIKGDLNPKLRVMVPANANGTVRMEDFLEVSLGQRECLLVWETKGKTREKRFQEQDSNQKQKSISREMLKKVELF